MQAGCVVDSESNDGRHDEGVAHASKNVGNLDIKLLPIVVEPTAVDDARADTVEADDPVGGKQSVEEKADDAGNTVLSQHIQTIINTDPELD